MTLCATTRPVDVTGPRDLPSLRARLVSDWQPNGQLARSLRFTEALGFNREIVAGEVAVNVEAFTQRYALPRAVLWWVTPQMAELVAHAARTLPPTTLTEELIPSGEAGMIVYGAPLQGTQADTGEPILTHLLLWCRGVERRSGRDMLQITSYRHVRVGDELGNSRVGIEISTSDYWGPTGSTSWLVGDDTEDPGFGGFLDDDIRMRSLSEDRRFLAATLLLASQPLSQVTTYARSKKKAKQSATTSDVRVVDLRPRPRTETDAETVGSPSRREHDHRWKVAGPDGTGFWRQQAYGPRWSQHRPIWIEPYEAGPKDKPLKLRETVHVLRSDP